MNAGDRFSRMLLRAVISTVGLVGLLLFSCRQAIETNSPKNVGALCPQPASLTYFLNLFKKKKSKRKFKAFTGARRANQRITRSEKIASHNEQKKR
jgi:hypothetical protein